MCLYSLLTQCCLSLHISGMYAHGTEMAGLAAASANNGICGVGVAHDAFVSGLSKSFV